MFPESLLSADDDWQESFRAKLYPKLHPYLKLVGGFGTATTRYREYVGTVYESEEVLERELVDMGFRRNPIAAYKHLHSGRRSDGSWCLLPEDSDLVEDGMQLHVTLYTPVERQDGRESSQTDVPSQSTSATDGNAMESSRNDVPSRPTSATDGNAMEVFAHYEDDWRERPFRHLRGTNLDRRAGVRKARRLFDDHTFVTLRERNAYDN